MGEDTTAIADVEICFRCVSLPRAGAWSHLSELPEGFETLRDAGSGLATCPDCGNVFRRSYEDEHDDGAYYETWTLQRLSPTEARSLDGELGDEWKSRYDARLAMFRQQLDHPQPRVREDAGWVLAHHVIGERDWASVADLLHRANRDAARVAADTLAEAQSAGLEVPDTVFGGAGDALAGLTRLLVRRHIRTNPQIVLQLLDSEDVERVEVALREVDGAHRDGLEVAPYLERLLALLAHPDREIRHIVSWIAGRLTDRDQVARAVETAISLLNHTGHGTAGRPHWDSADVRVTGCRLLESLANRHPDPHAVPRLIELLDDPATQATANRALHALGKAGADIDAALPALIRRLEHPWATDIELLEQLRAGGCDISSATDALVQIMLEAGTGNVQYQAYGLVCRLVGAGCASPTTLDTIQLGMARLYNPDVLAKSVARVRLERDDWTNIRALLTSSTTVAWATIDVLREAVDGGRDVSAVLDAVRAIVAANPGVVADHANGLLVAARYPPVDRDELGRRVDALRQVVADYEAWDDEFIPNPFDPWAAVASVVELGRGAIPTLLELAAENDFELQFWAIAALGEFGPAAGVEALALAEAKTGHIYVGHVAAVAVGRIDEERFFARGLYADVLAVDSLTVRHLRQGTAVVWLQKLAATGNETAIEAAVRALERSTSLDPAVAAARDELKANLAGRLR